MLSSNSLFIRLLRHGNLANYCTLMLHMTKMGLLQDVHRALSLQTTPKSHSQMIQMAHTNLLVTPTMLTTALHGCS